MVSEALAAARLAQGRWAARPLPERLRVIQRLRHMIAVEAQWLLGSLALRPNRAPAESLAAEILPLADACRFLERSAQALLAARRLGRRGRPAWLFGTKAEVRREPLGVVLIIAPDNYPLLLPGVQLIQALIAGNAVLVKPAPGCSEPVLRLGALLERAGLPQGLVQVLSEDKRAAEQAIEGGVDHVVLTGSLTTGRAVLAQVASRPTGSTMELSGSDAVFVLPGADLALVANALVCGLRFNGGATCIAPRRVFVFGDQCEALEQALGRRLADTLPLAVAAKVREPLARLLEEARDSAARFLPAVPEPDHETMRPTFVFGASPSWRFFREDVFAPLAAVLAVSDEEEALQLDRRSPYALGASVFGPPDQAYRLAERIDAGSVTINDLIVPTADPRLPFGGRHASGFGVTRGAEGLLAMTVPKVISVRSGSLRPHYAPVQEGHLKAGLLYLRAAHGSGPGARLRALGALLLTLPRLVSRRSGAGSRVPLRARPRL